MRAHHWTASDGGARAAADRRPGRRAAARWRRKRRGGGGGFRGGGGGGFSRGSARSSVTRPSSVARISAGRHRIAGPSQPISRPGIPGTSTEAPSPTDRATWSTIAQATSTIGRATSSTIAQSTSPTSTSAVATAGATTGMAAATLAQHGARPPALPPAQWPGLLSEARSTTCLRPARARSSTASLTCSAAALVSAAVPGSTTTYVVVESSVMTPVRAERRSIDIGARAGTA